MSNSQVRLGGNTLNNKVKEKIIYFQYIMGRVNIPIYKKRNRGIEMRDQTKEKLKPNKAYIVF